MLLLAFSLQPPTPESVPCVIPSSSLSRKKERSAGSSLWKKVRGPGAPTRKGATLASALVPALNHPAGPQGGSAWRRGCPFPALETRAVASVSCGQAVIPGTMQPGVFPQHTCPGLGKTQGQNSCFVQTASFQVAGGSVSPCWAKRSWRELVSFYDHHAEGAFSLCKASMKRLQGRRARSCPQRAYSPLRREDNLRKVLEKQHTPPSCGPNAKKRGPPARLVMELRLLHRAGLRGWMKL